MHHIWRILLWWEDWQMRILVLGSLGLQWFLLLAAPMRKFSIPHVFRKCIWLAYISSDALAIYALATLFNRHARSCDAAATASKQSSILEVLWAPILLIHLGGQKEMTGYEIEDNELWMRHTVTLVSQVAVALYSFCKSWPSSSDWKLLTAAVLLFVVGVASFTEKPFAVRRAKIKSLEAVSAWVQGTRKSSMWTERINQFLLFEECNCAGGGGPGRGDVEEEPTSRTGGEGEGSTSQPTSTNRATRRCELLLRLRQWCGGEKEGRNGRQHKHKSVALSEPDKVLMVLSDMSLLAAANDLIDRGRAEHIDDVLPPLEVAEQELPRWLRNAFAFIYTRATVVVNPLYLLYHLVLVPILHMAALTLFAMSHKHPYKRADVKTTYIIMCLTAALDVFAVFIRQLLYRLMSLTKVPALCQTVPQYNIIEAAHLEAHKKIGWMYRCARRMGCTSFSFCFCRRKHHTGGGTAPYGRVTQTVIIDLVGAQRRDLASYRIFDDSTAQAEVDSKNWALSKDLQSHCPRDGEIRRNLRQVSFDRCVLLWHIATDLCSRCSDDGGEEGVGGGLAKGKEAQGVGGGRAKGKEAQGVGGGKAKGKEAQGVGEGVGQHQQQRPRRDPSLQLHRECAVAISNYMAHLLNVHPEMLLTGSRQHLIFEAVKEVHHDYPFLSKDKLRKEDIKDILTTVPIRGHDDDHQLFHIKKACKLAMELLEMRDDATRWNLMYRVWLGMLCYSASMCRGYLHAKSLGEGGEFLSLIWLMLALKGARSLADKLQMPQDT